MTIIRHDPSPMAPVRRWLFWESAEDKIRMQSGVWRRVRPGDSVLAELHPVTNEVLQLVDHRKRVLH